MFLLGTCTRYGPIRPVLLRFHVKFSPWTALAKFQGFISVKFVKRKKKERKTSTFVNTAMKRKKSFELMQKRFLEGVVC